MPTNVMSGFKPSNVTSDLIINNQNFANDVKLFDMQNNSTVSQAFTEGATTLGANVSTGLGFVADEISNAIGTDKSNNKFFKSAASTLLDMRKDNGYVSGYDQDKAKKQLASGDALGAMETVGFHGTMEEFAKSLPYMLMYGLDPSKGGVASLGASTVSYAVENAQMAKGILGDKTPLESSDVLNIHNIANATAQAALDKIGFAAEAKAFSVARNIKARSLLNPSGGMKLGKETLRGFIGEGATEAAQTALQESYARNDYGSVFTSKDAQENVMFSGLLGGMIGSNAASAGTAVPSIKKSIGQTVTDIKNNKQISKDAIQSYESLSKEDKQSVSQSQYIKDYKDIAQSEVSREGSSVEVDNDAGSIVMHSNINNTPVSYNPITDEVLVAADDGSVAPVKDMTDDDKDTIKRNAVYETVKDMTNDDISAQQEMWKALGFDTDNDVVSKNILGSKIAENTAKETLESIINNASKDTADIINSKLMAEIASANEQKLEAMLKRKSMFGQSASERFSRVTSSWKVNNLSEDGKAKIIDFMESEKAYAESRLATLKASRGVEYKPVATAVAQPKVDKTAEKPKPKPDYIKQDKVMSKTGVEILAKNDNGTIILSKNKELWKQKFEEKAWSKPRVLSDGSSAQALPEDIFTTEKEFQQFVYAHEKAHDSVKIKDGESRGDYETRVNEKALEWMNKSNAQNVDSSEFDSKVKVEKKSDLSFSGKPVKDFMDSMLSLSMLSDMNKLYKRAGVSNESEASAMVDKFKALFSSVSSSVNQSVGFQKIKAGAIDVKAMVNKDPMSIFAKSVIVKDGIAYAQFDSELTDAISLVGLDAVIGASSSFGTDDGKAFLEKFFGDNVNELNNAIQYNGATEHLLAPQIGKRVLNVLGYKVDKSVGRQWMENLEAQIGFVALDAMKQHGFAESKTFKGESEKTMSLIKFTDKAKQMAVHMKPLVNALGKDVGGLPYIDNGSEIPVIETIRNTSLKISNKMKKALQKLQSKRYKINREMFDAVYDAVTTNDELDIAKVDKLLHLKSDEELAKIHSYYRGNEIQARNQARLQFERSFNFFTSLDDESFGYQYYISANGRAMTDSSFGGDYQQDKHFSRFVIDYIKPDGTTEYETNESNQHEFVFGILQALEPMLEDMKILVRGVDKSTSDMNRKAFRQFLKEVSKMKDDELIQLGLKYNGIHGFRGMKEFVKHRNSFNGYGKLKAGVSFNTDLLFEADGITNGLSHQILQTIIGSVGKFNDEVKDIFQKVGILPKENMSSQKFNNSGESKLDTYETIASIVNDLLLDKKYSNDNSVKIFKYVVGDIKRKTAKSPVMVFQYGASEQAIAMKIADEAMSSLIAKVSSNEISAQDLDSIIRDSDGALKFLRKIKGNPDSIIHKSEYSSGAKFFADGVGKSFGEAMSNKFPTISQYQQSAYEAGSHIRKIITTSAKYKELVSKLNDSSISVEEYNKTKQQIEALIPRYATAWSDNSGSAMTMTSHNIEKKISDDGSSRSIRYWSNGKQKTASYVVKREQINESSFFDQEDDYSAYGAGDKSKAVTMTHSIDGAVMNESEVIDSFAMQIFDAVITGVGDMEKAGVSYNKTFAKINTMYSSFISIMDGLFDTVKIANSIGSDAQAIIEAKKFLSRKYSDAADSIQSMKNYISGIHSINQMSGFDGGVYNFDAKAKDAIYKHLNGVELSLRVKASDTFPTQFEAIVDEKNESVYGSNVGKMPKHKVISDDEFSFNEKDIVDVFDMLGQYEKPSNTDYLRSFVSSISNSIGKPSGEILSRLKISKNDIETVGQFYKESGSIHISISDNIKNNQYMTAQEVFAHELVHKASEYALYNEKGLNSQVKQLMDKAKEKFDSLGGYEYFMNIMPDGRINAILSDEEEISAAKEKYEYIFTNPSEFFTFGLTNEQFSTALSQMHDEKGNSTFLDRMIALFDAVVNFISSKLGTAVMTSGSYDKQLADLSVAIFALNKAHSNESIFSVASDKLDSVVDDIDSSIESKIQSASKTIINKAKPLVDVFESMAKASGLNTISESRVIRSIFNEVVGETDVVKSVLKLMRTKEVYQKIYNDARHDLSQLLKERLPSTDKQDVAIQMAIVDTDIQSLGISASEAAELLINNDKLSREIEAIENSIDSNAKSKEQKSYANYVINQANGLGLLLGKGIVGLKAGQMTNAYNIVGGKYYKGSVAIDKRNMEVSEAMIDKLATLYAIKYTDSNAKAVAANYIHNNESSVDELLGMMKSYVAKSKQLLFAGEEHLASKGFSNTIMNQDMELDVVPVEKIKEMTYKGFKVVRFIESSKKVIMKRYNPQVKFTEGIMDTEQQGKKGAKDTAFDPFSEEPEVNKQDMSSIALSRFGSLNHIPAGTNTLPLVDRKEVGAIASYRFVANKALRINELGQEYRMSKVLPDTFAMTQRKFNGMINNRVLANKLVNMMRNDMPNNPENYVPIINDGDTEVLYRMIPEDMRRELGKILKGGDLYVHRDLLENVFGYKNFSISNIKIIKDSKRMKWVARIGEKIWEDLVSHVRKNVIFKTKDVVIDNIISNFITLVWRGMNPIKAMKYMDEGRILMNQYRKDLSIIKRLETLRDAGSPYDNVVLNSALKSKASNPVNRLVKAGQFQSIIDDIDVELEDTGNIPELIGNAVVSRLPKLGQDIVNNLYINENTRIYKFLMKTVQYSDFVARYAFFKHMTVDKKAPTEEAIDEVEGMFINYSILQNRYLQYASDSGLFMFSKYFLRIQRQIARAFKKNAARGAGQIINQKITGDVSDMSDSFIGTSSIFGRSGVDPSDVLSPHLPEWFV